MPLRAPASPTVKNFIDSIRAGKANNDTASAVQSKFSGILGRMAAYCRDVVAWDEMVARKCGKPA
ncbi:MAG TPA: hypothetical protein VN428_09805 [Bryobacteraceae bacterium]|nr:hypothetical protein [Bryobacteraceae bacterium]